MIIIVLVLVNQVIMIKCMMNDTRSTTQHQLVLNLIINILLLTYLYLSEYSSVLIPSTLLGFGISSSVAALYHYNKYKHNHLTRSWNHREYR